PSSRSGCGMSRRSPAHWCCSRVSPALGSRPTAIPCRTSCGPTARRRHGCGPCSRATRFCRGAEGVRCGARTVPCSWTAPPPEGEGGGGCCRGAAGRGGPGGCGGGGGGGGGGRRVGREGGRRARPTRVAGSQRQ